MWVCNSPVSLINKVINNNNDGGPSWIEGLLCDFTSGSGIELAYCFPQRDRNELIAKEVKKLRCYGFYNKKQPYIYNKSVEKTLQNIIREFQPDILHIFGTEYSHALAAIRAFGCPEKTIISIQGLCHIISRHYYADLPHHIVNRYLLRDLMRNDSIKKQAGKFKKRGIYEIESISNVQHVIGRTDFDRACCLSINPNVQYHFCNEVLRDSFYNNKWDIKKCERYSIFFSQCYYPIKGFHFMLEALGRIIGDYPQTHLYVAGMDITKSNTIKDKLRISSYGEYIRTLIKKYKLEKFITFLGQLNEDEMCKRFLKSHVFVSASSIENSPNSVGEAIMLGVPTVCSDVGGVKNLVTHNQDGYMYQWNAPYMLAYYMEKIFKDDELAISISKRSQAHACTIYDREINKRILKGIYKTILTS